jgi:two-component system chemotaxis response regulator CheB
MSKCRAWILDFLEKLMRLRPMPVVMVSSLTGKGSEITLRALELGAWILSPNRSSVFAKGCWPSEMIAEKIRTASRQNCGPQTGRAGNPEGRPYSARKNCW